MANVCTSSGSLADLIANGQFFEAMYCPYADPLGLAFPLLVFGAIGVSLYIYSGSAILPLTMTIILGSVVIVQLPSVATQFAGAVILLIIAGLGYQFVIKRGPAR